MGPGDDGGRGRRRGIGLAALVAAALLGALLLWWRADGQRAGEATEEDEAAKRRGGTGVSGGGDARESDDTGDRGGASEPLAPLRLMTARTTADPTATAGAVSGWVLSRSDGSPVGGVLSVDVELTPTGPDEPPRVELAGIGVVLSAEEDVLMIGRAVEGGGAAEVGLGPGDAILAVEGVPVGELGFQGSIERIRGPEGSTVRLRIRRADGSVAEIDVPRRRIRA